MINRVILIILDSVGVGCMPDSLDYGDVNCNTLSHVAEFNNGLNISNMEKLGIGNIIGVSNINKENNPVGCFGRMAELSVGKDTTTGHWEITGIHTPKMFPTFPDGFPNIIIQQFIDKCKIPGVLGNCVASGTEIITKLGDEHVETKKPIVYTSADSVFQIACHEGVYPVEELYKMSQIARELLIDDNRVARVIARPFLGENGKYERTTNRRDFSIMPSQNNVLSKLKQAGYEVAGVGKIEDIFAGVGITKSIHTKDNQKGIDETINYMKTINQGLIFTNLVEFDSKWGHRNDATNYGRGLEEFDARLPEIIDAMNDNDLLIISADHGCDPTTKGTDHTREYVPLLLYGNSIKKGVDLKTLNTFADIGQTIAEIFKVDSLPIGTSLLEKIML